MKEPSSPEGLIPALASTHSPAAPRRIESGEHYIYQEPRISAAKLAEYMIAGAARQKKIVQNAKIAPKVLLAYYREVRDLFPVAYTHGGLNADFMERKAQEIERRTPESTWQKEENPRCAAALRKLAQLAVQIDCAGGHRIHRPQGGWGGIMIGGVYVSVNPELTFSITHRGIIKVGGVILNTGKNAGASLARSHEGHTAGDYLTTLLYRMLEQRLKTTGIPLHTRCYAIDVARDTIYSAPSAHKRILRNLEAACEVIALRWDSIPSEVPVESEAFEDDS